MHILASLMGLFCSFHTLQETNSNLGSLDNSPAARGLLLIPFGYDRELPIAVLLEFLRFASWEALGFERDPWAPMS